MDSKDYLDEVIEERLKNDPEFAANWPAFEARLKEIEEHLRQQRAKDTERD